MISWSTRHSYSIIWLPLSVSVSTMWFFLLLHLGKVLFAFGQVPLLDEIQKLYLKQGIPYRENIYLENKPILEEYDFVVVGSGPAGSAIANRLTEVPGWTVLLLEGGPEPNLYNDIPFINPISILGNFSRFYPVEKTKNACQALINGQCQWPAGEVVGGASIINGMIYTRGHPTDYDEWAAEGNPGWSYADVLPYFLKYENIEVPALKNSLYHGRGGPVQIEWPVQTKAGQRFIRACKEAGIPFVDYNNPFTPLGVSITQAAIKNGRRVSALSAYLEPAKNRPNLHITKNTPATQILIDPITKIAYGVKFRRKGVERVVLVRREVILSAGAFNSPKLLMLSGIGHSGHLEALGIPVIVDLPVGDHLQEHVGTPLVSFLINTTESVIFNELLRNTPTYLLQWMNGKKGLFGNNAVEALAYIKTPYATDPGRPDIEYIFLPITLGSDAGAAVRKTLSLGDDQFESIWKNYYFRHGFSIFPMIMYPKSRGKIRLRSANFDDPPIVDGNFFDDPHDSRVLIAAVREILKLQKMRAFKEANAKLHSRPLKYCAHHKFNSDAYWECAIRAVPIQYHHQCGTCRMGPDPRTSVVDPRLRVHGVRGLRVADASIMPRIPGPHTMAASYMIGEKAADLIKEEHFRWF